MRALLALLLALTVGLNGCALLQPGDELAASAQDRPERQILVMLRAPPPHFRPDLDYATAYLARTQRGSQRRIADDIAQRHALKVVTAWPMPALGLDCFVMEAPGSQAIAGLVDAVAHDERVESAQAMNVFHMLDHNDPLYPLQPAARQWNLSEVHRVATGRDVRIAAVDTGVELDHPDLLGRVALARNFAGLPEPAGEAHGTAVAGIIAARADDGIGIAGVAPDAKLLALRACRQEAGQPGASCTSFTIALALQFALDQNAQVINLSLGGPRDRLLERLIEVALRRRIVVVGAVDPRLGGGGFPASYPGVLAVASASDRNPPPGALVAPGRDVPAAMPGHAWGFVTGSSYAAAQVSGAVALLLERAPAMDGAQVRGALAADGLGGIVAGQAVAVDVCSAIARATTACVCGCVVAQNAGPARAR